MARGVGRQKKLQLEHLVVDELIILKKKIRQRGLYFRAKGGTGRIRTETASVWLRLREVPGARMKTRVLKPWFERRYKHRKGRHGAGDAAGAAGAPLS
jgi:hypothetical protein